MDSPGGLKCIGDSDPDVGFQSGGVIKAHISKTELLSKLGLARSVKCRRKADAEFHSVLLSGAPEMHAIGVGALLTPLWALIIVKTAYCGDLIGHCLNCRACCGRGFEKLVITKYGQPTPTHTRIRLQTPSVTIAEELGVTTSAESLND
jgi:hypothetical protein